MKVLLIILGIILFFIGILSIPFHVYTQYIDEFSLYVRWLFVKIHIIPKPEKKKKKKKKKKKEEKPKDEEKPEEEEEKEEEKPKEKGDNFIKVFYNNQGVPGMINLIGTIAKKLKKGLHKIGKAFYIRELWLRINVGEGDSAATAEKYGKICAAVYPSLGYIINCVHAKKCSVKIQPDFLGGKTEGGFKLHLFLVPSKLIGSAIGMGISLGIELLKVLISNAKSSSKGKKETVKAMDNAAEIMAEATEKSVDDDTNKTQKGGKNK
ncbi:MAG: DUF2953 domain-containing protein [Clostridia bacterium]|nr:DUF2953 domain-containing protein [Clostridia bacterium]